MTSAYQYLTDAELARRANVGMAARDFTGLTQELHRRGLVMAECGGCDKYHLKQQHDYLCVLCRAEE